MKDLPPIPWQPRPAGSSELLWRFDRNPLTKHRPAPGVTAIYNSAVIPWEGAFLGVFRGDRFNGMPTLFLGSSPDGIAWTFDPAPIPLQGDDPHVGIREYAYDPRIVAIEGRHFVMWCNGYHGPTIGLAETRDFKTFQPLENAFLPCNRNGVLFPRKINGRYAMLNRPSDNGHTPFGDIFYSESPDLTFWGRHRHVMGKGPDWWSGLKGHFRGHTLAFYGHFRGHTLAFYDWWSGLKGHFRGHTLAFYVPFRGQAFYWLFRAF